MFVIQCSQTFSNRSGRIRVRPLRVAASARSASGPVRMNHCVLSRGSMTSFDALAAADDHLVGPRADQVAARLEVGEDPLARLVAVEAVVAPCRCSAIAAASSRTVIIGRPWRRPVS